MMNVCPTSHKLGKIWEVKQEVVIFCCATPCLFPWPLYLRPKKFFIESTLGKLGLSAGIDLAVGCEMPVAHAGSVFLSHVKEALLQVFRDQGPFQLPAPPFLVSPPS